ncbi:MAG: phage terminase large subunit [Candidatus Paceibacterota bacterium]|jgi:phage terminase large subunit
MLQRVNSHYKPLFTQRPRYFILMGGRGAGRSTSASQYALARLGSTEYFRCAAMRLVLNDVRNSIFQDILDQIDLQELTKKVVVREAPKMSIALGKNRIDGIGFRKSSGDQKSKLKSLANYNTVIIEEADEVPEEDFMQLDDSLRTIKTDIVIVLLLNAPPKNHWIIKRWFNLEPALDPEGKPIEGFYRPVLKSSVAHNTIHIGTNYEENYQNLNETTIANFEGYKTTRPDHYWNMIKGLVSEGARGRIFKTWRTIPDKEFDELPYPSIYGLDFGFTNHPTALVEVKQHNQKVWLKELLYEPGLTNPKISKRLTDLGVSKTAPIYADSAEPKSIQEISGDGWNILPADKGPDSISAGLDMLLEKEVAYTESSTNIAKESQEYKWALDRNKEPTNTPIDAWNHAMDGVRYAVFTDARKGFIGFV